MTTWASLKGDEAAKVALIQKHVLGEGLSYADFGALVDANKNQIAGFIFNHRPEIYGEGAKPVHKSYYVRRPEGQAPKNSFHTEADFTEKWTPKQRATRSVSPAKGTGRPMAIPVGSDLERQFKSMWAAGTVYKVICAELGLSEKALKNARVRLKLKSRREDVMKGVDMRLHLDPKTHSLLRQACSRKGSSKARYIRDLIRRDNE